jgi:hypothetical protein
MEYGNMMDCVAGGDRPGPGRLKTAEADGLEAAAGAALRRRQQRRRSGALAVMGYQRNPEKPRSSSSKARVSLSCSRLPGESERRNRH